MYLFVFDAELTGDKPVPKSALSHVFMPLYILHSHPIAPLFRVFVFQSQRECTANMRPSRTNTMSNPGSWRTP